EEAFTGREKEIVFHRLENCARCEGTGLAPGSSPRTCPTCQGRGQVIRSQGFFQISSTCPTCHGQGQVITDPCPECRGQGQVEAEKRLTVKIPAGVDTGSQLRLRGEGEPGAYGGPPGDLFVVIHVREHELFTREGEDLYCNLPISFVQAALGDTLEIPVLGDEQTHTLEIPPGTQPGDMLRVPGKGMPSLRSHQRRGDLFLRAVVKIPRKMNQRQRELLEAFAQEEGLNVSGGKKKETFWKKMTKF
ncbi:MAG: molecular chaperone DnaJ, partial [Deltaproteobacteria bacterium]|nr:molecular chaperone DnaJ [Deltaproteobacteria bacterium]